jgi:hypothetical protein
MSTRRVKKPGSIIKPSGVINTKREIIDVSGKSMILTQFETPRSFTIYIGGDDIYCIDAQVTRDLTGKFNPEGYLTKVRWDMDCSLDKDFQEGKDTQMITQLALTYIKKSFPDVKEISFSDVSERRCDNGASVSLSAMKYITDGQTWYESHFNATIHPRNKESYENMKKDIDTLKQITPWEDFSERWLRLQDIDISKEELQTIYNSSDTWQDFFKEIRSRIGVSAFCIWLSKEQWFKYFMEDFLKFNVLGVRYLLTVDTFNVPYTIVSGGKRRVTRSRQRAAVGGNP